MKKFERYIVEGVIIVYLNWLKSVKMNEKRVYDRNVIENCGGLVFVKRGE